MQEAKTPVDPISRNANDTLTKLPNCTSFHRKHIILKERSSIPENLIINSTCKNSLPEMMPMTVSHRRNVNSIVSKAFTSETPNQKQITKDKSYYSKKTDTTLTMRYPDPAINIRNDPVLRTDDIFTSKEQEQVIVQTQRINNLISKAKNQTPMRGLNSKAFANGYEGYVMHSVKNELKQMDKYMYTKIIVRRLLQGKMLSDKKSTDITSKNLRVINLAAEPIF